MSQAFLLRKALTNSEAPLLSAGTSSYMFRSIYISNNGPTNVKIYLAITSGKSFASIGDWLIWDKEIAISDYLYLENIFVPAGHQFRGYADYNLTTSLVASGVMD